MWGWDWRPLHLPGGVRAVAAGAGHCVAADGGGGVWAWGEWEHGQAGPAGGWPAVEALLAARARRAAVAAAAAHPGVACGHCRRDPVAGVRWVVLPAGGAGGREAAPAELCQRCAAGPQAGVLGRRPVLVSEDFCFDICIDR